MKLWKELKRRNVFRAIIAYLVFSWLVLQIIAILFPILQIDLQYQRWVLIALVVGFPAWTVFAYIYDWTPEGFKQTPEADAEESIQKPSNTHSTRYIIFGLSLALILLVADKVFHLSSGISSGQAGLSTIAVLPFSHQSDTEEDEFFTSGVHEDLMTKLAGVRDFRIISRSSVMPYKDYEGDLKEVGRTLNADYIMQGSVRRWKEQVRMTVQLVESNTDQAIWSHEYDGKLENVFDLQADIATEITRTLQANLSRTEARELESAPTTVLAAYDDFLKARHLLHKPRATYDDLKQSILLLDKAVEADGKFTKAWMLLVQAHSELYNLLMKMEGRTTEMEEAKSKAEFALNTAKQLAPDQWEVLSGEGFYYMNIADDKILALASFEKAIEENPSDVNSMAKLAQLYVTMGDIDKGIDILERGFRLTQTNGFMAYSLTFAYEMKGEYEKMVPFLERLYELYPGSKHYLVEARYYQFLQDGSLASFRVFQESIETADAENPWDERAIKNMEMIVAMFNDEFDEYHEAWKGKHEQHIKNHGNWMCPLVANEHINQARLLIEHQKTDSASAILEEVRKVVLKPVNPNSVCVFNPQVYLPKLDFLSGEESRAREKIEELAIPVLQNQSFPLGAVERSVLLQAVDLIAPDKVYYYYEQIVKNTISMTSFESICADPWTYPNLIRDPRFVEEVKEDGRFVEFLDTFGFLS